MANYITGRELGSELLNVLKLPECTTKFTLTCENTGLAMVTCEYEVFDLDIQEFKSLLSNYKLVEV